MKRIIMIVFALMTSVYVFSQGIQFEHGTLEQALQKANDKKKLVFMDCYTSWCGPCKHLSEKIFTQEKVGAFFNANFINIKMDIESDEGKVLLKKYPVKAYPTLFYLEADGEIRHLMVGAGDAERILKGAQAALDPEKNWKAMHKRFIEGERSLDFLRAYIMTGAQARMPIKQASFHYFSQKKNEALINAEDVQLIMFSVTTTTDPVFQYLVKNRELFYEVAEKKRIDQYIENTMSREIGMLGRQRKFDEMEAKKMELIQLDKALGTKVVLFTEMHMSHIDQGKSYQSMIKYAKTYEFDNAERLNEYACAIAFSKHDGSADLMDDALLLAARAVELDGNYKNLDVYAVVLDKSGRSEEGKKYAKDALALAPKEQKESLRSNYLLKPEN